MIGYAVTAIITMAAGRDEQRRQAPLGASALGEAGVDGAAFPSGRVR